MSTRQTEIRHMEEVEMDQIPDIHQETEPPARQEPPRRQIIPTEQDTPPRRAPTARKPRGTALMDAPGWSNFDTGNIIKSNNEGRCTRSNTGNAMQAESLNQDDIGAGLGLITSVLTNMIQSALMNTLKESGILEKGTIPKMRKKIIKTQLAPIPLLQSCLLYTSPSPRDS